MSRIGPDDPARKRPEWVRRPHREVDVDEGYAYWSRIYDHDLNALLAPEAEMVADLLAELEFETALDAAAGTGRHLPRLSRARSIVALDRSREMLDVAAAKLPNRAVTIVRGDLQRLPLRSESVDLVLCALALCHLPALEPATAEFFRVLKPGGHLLVSDFHPTAVEWGLRSEFDLDGLNYRLPNPQHGLQGYIDAIETAEFKTRRVTELTMGMVGLDQPKDLTENYVAEWPDLPFTLGILAQRR